VSAAPDRTVDGPDRLSGRATLPTTSSHTHIAAKLEDISNRIKNVRRKKTGSIEDVAVFRISLQLVAKDSHPSTVSPQIL